MRRSDDRLAEARAAARRRRLRWLELRGREEFVLDPANHDEQRRFAAWYVDRLRADWPPPVD